MQYQSINTQLTLFQKLRNLDFILIFCILLLGFVSSLAMYSTDGGEFLFHTKSHIRGQNAIFILKALYEGKTPFAY